MSSSKTSPPPPQTSAKSSPVSESHVVNPRQTTFTASPQAVPVCNRFVARSCAFGKPSSGADASPPLPSPSTAMGVMAEKDNTGAAVLRNSVLVTASSPLDSSASSTPAQSVPILAMGASLLGRLKSSLTSPDAQVGAISATTTAAAPATCALLTSKIEHTRAHRSVDADSVEGSTSGGGGERSPSSPAASVWPGRQSPPLKAIAAPLSKLYRPPHAREDSLQQHRSAGDSGGGGGGSNNKTEASLDVVTTTSGATVTPSMNAAATAGVTALAEASSSSPSPLCPSVSTAVSEPIVASSDFAASKANALPPAAPPHGSSTGMATHLREVAGMASYTGSAADAHGPVTTLSPKSAAETHAETDVVTSASSHLAAPRRGGSSVSAVLVSSGTPVAPSQPPATSEGNQPEGAAAEAAESTEFSAAEKQEAEPSSKPSRSAKRKHKMRVAAAAAAAAAAAEKVQQPGTAVVVDIAAESNEVVAAHPEDSPIPAASGRKSTRIIPAAHSSSSRTASAPTSTAAAPNTSNVSRRPGWHPPSTTSAAVSATLPGEGAVHVTSDTEVVGRSWSGGPQMMTNGPTGMMTIPLAGTPFPMRYAGHIANTMLGMSDASEKLLPAEMATADCSGNAGYMNGYGYQQQQQTVTHGRCNCSPIVPPQQQQHPHLRPSASDMNLGSAAATISPRCSSTSAKALLTAGAVNASMKGAAATMFDSAAAPMSASGGGAPRSPQRAPGLHRGRAAAAAAKAKVQAAVAASQSVAGQFAPSASPSPGPAATGSVSSSTPLLLRNGHLPSIRIGVSSTMNADPSSAADHASAPAAASMAATGGAGSPTLSMATGIPRHHHTPPLAHPSSVSGQFSQRPHHHHHHTTSLGSVSLDSSSGGGNIITSHHEDMLSQSPMSPGAGLEHTLATISSHTLPRSQGGVSATMSWGSIGGSNHGRSTNTKHKGTASDHTYSRGSNSHSASTIGGFINNLRSGSRHGHPQQQVMSMSQSGNHMNPMYGGLPNLQQQGTSQVGSSAGGMMHVHHNTLNVGSGGAGQQPMSHRRNQHQQHPTADPPPIPYYDFIMVLPTFVATCLTLKPADEANREQLCWTIEAVLRKNVSQTSAIRVHGSITTGLALPSSDVDLLAVGYEPIAPLEALQRLSQALLELDEDSKNDALRLQELIEAEAQYRRRQLVEEEKDRAKQTALVSAAAAPDEDRHQSRENRSSSSGSASESYEAASLHNPSSDADGSRRWAGEKDRKSEGASGLSPKRVARGRSIATTLLGAAAPVDLALRREIDEVARAAPNRAVSGDAQRSSCVFQDGTATATLQQNCSASLSSTESSTTCSSAAAFPLDTRKVFLTASTTADDDDEFVRLASGPGFGGTVPGPHATSTSNKSGVGHACRASAGRLRDSDMAAADTEFYGTVNDVEQAEEVFRGQIEKGYNFSTSMDLSVLFAPSRSGGMPPVAPPPPLPAAAAASCSDVERARSSGGGLALQASITQLHDSASSPSQGSAPASGNAELKGGALPLSPVMTTGLNIGEDITTGHAQMLPRSKLAAADTDKSATETECQCRQSRPAGDGAAAQEGRNAGSDGDAAAAEAEATDRATEIPVTDEATRPPPSSVSPRAATASGEKAAVVQTTVPLPAPQDAVTRNPVVLGGSSGGASGHLTYVPVREGPLFFVQCITATRVPVIKLTDKATGTKVDITFAGGEHWRSMQLTRSLLEVFPHARPLILFLKYCVRSLGVGESEPGGVTSFAIYLMVLHFYHECRKRILLLLRERNAASSPSEGKACPARADAREQQRQHRSAVEALRCGDTEDKSAASPATPHSPATAYQGSSPTGTTPLNLGLLEQMLGEYLARVEKRRAQVVEDAGARRCALLDATGISDVGGPYSSGGDTQKVASALRKASPSTAVATGVCATIKAAYAGEDEGRLRSIRQAILGFVGDPAASTRAAGTSMAAAVALPPPPSQIMTGATTEEESDSGRTQQPQRTFSDTSEGASCGGAVIGASSSNNSRTLSPLHEQQLPKSNGTAGTGSATGIPSAGEVLAPVVDGAPGRLAPPPHHYLLKTVEPQPHERVMSDGSCVDKPRAGEATGRGEKVEEETSVARLTAAVATPEESTIAAAGSADDMGPEKADRHSTESTPLPAEAETAGAATASPDGKGDSANGQDAAGANASPAAAASTLNDTSEDHDDDNAFEAFAADFLRRQANVSDLFLDFCHYYGCAFDYETSGIRFATDGSSEVVAKPLLCSRRGQHFHMTSPFDPEYDLTARMTHMRDFQWLCWWFAEWGVARQSPQYYGSCSLQYVLQCLSPMSADVDCQAVHQALMQRAVAAARSAESAVSAGARAQNHSNGGAADEGGHSCHGRSAPTLAFQENVESTRDITSLQQRQSAPRPPRTMMSTSSNAHICGAQREQALVAGGNTAVAMPINPHTHPQPQQQRVSMTLSPMHAYSGTHVEQQPGGDAAVVQHYAAEPFPHLHSMMMMPPGSPACVYQQLPQQRADPSGVKAMDAAAHPGGGGFGGHDHRSAPLSKGRSGSTSAAKKSTASRRHQGSDGVSTTVHNMAATHAASSGSSSRPASEAGSTPAASASGRTHARRRTPLQLPYVDSREQVFDGSTNHAVTTPTTAGVTVAHGYLDEGDEAAVAAASRTVSPPHGESQEGGWTSLTATACSGNSPLDCVDVALMSVEEDEDEDEAGGHYGGYGEGSESVVDYADRFEKYGGRANANATMLRHYQQQLAPHDVQVTAEAIKRFTRCGADAEGNADVCEQDADGPCDGYTPNMTYGRNHGHVTLQRHQMSYGSPYVMNQPAGVYVSPKQQQYQEQQQQQEQAAAAAAFYYQAFAQQQQQQQQPIISRTCSGLATTAGSSSSPSYPFTALHYDVQQHLWQQQQQQPEGHTTRHSSGFVDVVLTAAADQDGGSNHRSDGASNATATSANAPQQQQQQPAFTYTPYVGYPSVIWGVGGAHSTDAARTAGGGGAMPQQPQTPSRRGASFTMNCQNLTTVRAAGSPVNSSSSGGASISASEPQKPQQSPHSGHRHSASHHHSSWGSEGAAEGGGDSSGAGEAGQG
nr:unnamed protein product [Leishmania braziliensis]